MNAVACTDGYDGGTKISGIEHHLLVDTRGTVLTACVSPAKAGDRDGAAVLFSRTADAFPRLRHVWADQGYRGVAFSRLGARDHRHQRRGRAAPRRRIPLDLSEVRGTASGRAPPRGGPGALGGRADARLAGTVPPSVEGLRVPERVFRETPSTSPWTCSLPRRLTRPAR
ncbi:transposase [Streptomyces griseoviridis]|uniref:transposase n=1 Tax=Streptomyces griseoviridis TaxID=45398 RepID=UPI003F4D275A